jgi:serine/tyrosine/threonine adenylyltransferase
MRLSQITSHMAASNGATNGHHANGLKTDSTGTTLEDIPKSNIFTSNLPPDPLYPTPIESHVAPRVKLGPRMVRSALYTYVRPEPTEEPELLGVSRTALRDIGLAQSEATSDTLKAVVAGNKFFWNEDTEQGIYPWAQCYGGFQFGSWAGQLGDGRAISLVETTNPTTQTRYELQLKGAGKTPYSRFADGKAVLRSSIREYVVSEYLNSLSIPTTRALSLTLCPKSQVVRERLEPGAIVCRFAQSWIRFGTFDLMRSRGDRDLIRKTATYVAEHVYGGWDKLPSYVSTADAKPNYNITSSSLEGPEGAEQNRFARLYRAIARNNALTVAKWQAYGFMNGVLNTDNTSILGLSMDYGPFAFLDNFDPAYTPNHDDHSLRYSYRAQPSIIWWNLVRLGEALGELLGAGERTDDEVFVTKGVDEEFAPILIARAEKIIDATGEEYKAVFLAEYKRLMTARLGLKTQNPTDFDDLFSPLLDTMEALELDFNHFFRRLGSVSLASVSTPEARKSTATRFFHAEGVTGLNEDNASGAEKVATWLEKWAARVREDWGTGDEARADKERAEAMRKVNPNFVPRGWVLDEVIERVEKKGDREVLGTVMRMVEDPFREEAEWEWDESGSERAGKDAGRFVGDVPRFQRAMQCSCSS